MIDESLPTGRRAGTRRRAALLATVVGVALLVAACGRASEREINALLGITPTATRSAAEISTATAQAAAQATSQAAAVAAAGSPGAGSPAAGGLAMGDVSRGNLQFRTWCSNCHRPGGAGPDILAPGGPGAGTTPDTLLAFLRSGEAHGRPPGPYTPAQLSDRTIADIAAYIRAQAGG